MNNILTEILKDVLEIAKQTDGIIGAWNFGSVKNHMADEYSDRDVVFLVEGERFREIEQILNPMLQKVCNKVLLCFEEGFNCDAIINNGYLLKKDSAIVQFDIFLLNGDKLDDFMCRLHYIDLSEEDILFDYGGVVKELCSKAPEGSYWQDDIHKLVQNYWYHFHMTAKYILRRDYFKLYHVVHILYDFHASLLLTAYDKIRWGGPENKLHFIPEQLQSHLKLYQCTEDFARNQKYLYQAAEWFVEDVEEICKEQGINNLQMDQEVLEYWMSLVESK